MAVRLPGLFSLLHVREHIEVGFRIVIEHAPSGRHIVAEGCCDKGRTGQEPSEPLGHLCQRVHQRLSLEQCATFRAEFIERVSHGMISERSVLSYTRSRTCASAVSGLTPALRRRSVNRPTLRQASPENATA